MKKKFKLSIQIGLIISSILFGYIELYLPWMWAGTLYITPRFYILLCLVIVFLIINLAFKLKERKKQT